MRSNPETACAGYHGERQFRTRYKLKQKNDVHEQASENVDKYVNKCSILWITCKNRLRVFSLLNLLQKPANSLSYWRVRAKVRAKPLDTYQNE